MSPLFGTDGVRGIPGRPPLTPAEVRRLGRAAGEVFLRARRRVNGTPPYVLMGRDTRDSGPALGRALAQGFAAAGCVTRDLGVIPTPGVSYLAARRGALCGVVISASHNPPEFNGIKFFSGDGFKLPVQLERRIESAFRAGPALRAKPLGRMFSRDADGMSDYLDFLRSTFPPTLGLAGRRIVVDASNGAAAAIAPGLLRGLGAEVFAIGCAPDGANINKGCGALATERMRRAVVRRKADAGVALDGDADRAVFADEKGRLLDGDALIALAALTLERQGLLRGGKVALTVMSNLGLINFLASRGIGTVQVPVGDRNVTDAIMAEGLSLGGENSGHIVYRRLAPTGDGLLTALQTLAAWLESGRRISAVRTLYRVYPQILKNIRIDRRVPLAGLNHFQRALRACEKKLGSGGRVFVRYSGTEPLLRILVEGRAPGMIKEIADELSRVFLEEVEAKLAKGV
ncbi:MAG: phosphoglucosamine mutase [Elusimicrobiota bacterium]